MPNDVLTLDQIQDAVTSRLGGSGVDIEIDNNDVLACLQDAIRLYNRCRPQRDIRALPVTPTQKRYGPLDVTYKGLRGVVACEFVQPGIQANAIDPFNTYGQVTNSTLGMGASGSDIIDVEQQLEYLETARNIGSSETEWKGMWDRVDKHYYLFISISTPQQCSITYTWHVTPDDDPDTGMSFIPDGDTDWIINFTIAKAKQLLGRIRVKHGGIVNPDGATNEVDGAAMLSEGRDDEKDLKLEIEARRRPLLPEIG